MKWIGLICLLLFASSVAAQTTTVTGTVTDQNGNPYGNGTASAAVQLGSGQPIAGIVLTRNVPTSAAGAFSFSGTNALTTGQAYIFTICAPPINLGPRGNPTPPQSCFSSLPIVLSGASQDISSMLNAIAPPLGPVGNNISGNAATATALQNTPAQCGANSLATGITANGTANCTSSPAVTNLTVSGTATFTGPLVPKFFDNVQIVDSTLSRGGVDICDELNKAYIAGPAAPSLVTTWLAGNSTGTPYSCTTPLAFTTKGKYFKIINLGACIPVSGSGLSGPGCVNWTPTTGNAITVDVYDSTAGDPPFGYGFYDFGIVNNNCTTTNGCGGTANGIVIGSTNGGANDMTMSNASIFGFGGKGYINTNLNSPNVHWIRPHFTANAVAMQHAGIAEKFEGGEFSGNGCIELAATNSPPELTFTDVTAFTNTTGPSCAAEFDFTNEGTGFVALLNLTNFHHENSSATVAHYISGNVAVHQVGGQMEDDNPTGTGDWMVSLSGNGSYINSSTIVRTARPYTNIYLMGANSRAEINDTNGSSPTLTCAMFVGGANAAFATQRINPLNSSQAPCAWKFESAVLPNGQALTLKKGSGGGNYTNATTSYTVADSTNLCLTVTIPTGWKLGISLSGAIGTATGVAAASLAITDNAACSTANAGILVETTETTTAAGVLQPVSLNWVITGDGASHNVALQFKTSNAADAATLLNTNTTQLPAMVFTLMPSN